MLSEGSVTGWAGKRVWWSDPASTKRDLSFYFGWQYAEFSPKLEYLRTP